MTSTREAVLGARATRTRAGAWFTSWPGLGLVAAVALMAAAMIVPVSIGWHTYANAFPPLSANWRPRWGIGTAPAVLVGIAAVRWAPTVARHWRWPAMVAAVFAGGLAWLVSLALVDGRAGIAAPLDLHGYNDYLPTARSVHSVSALLHEFVARIPAGAPHSWVDHVAAHPPGALLFFVLLTRIGLGGGLAAGLVVTVVAATVPVSVLVTLRRLAGAGTARRVAPILTFGPAAIWSAVSGDAVFAACVAWMLAAVAAAATSSGRSRVIGWSVLSGCLFGVCLMMSYGLALVGLVVVAVLLAARSARPVPGFAAGLAAVVVAFAVGGFRWWTALPALHERYYASIARVRPAAYWTWGDVGALCFSAGPMLGVSLALCLRRVRACWRGPRPTQAIVLLVLGTAACVACADASLLSKAEVERIWLPFVPWLLLGVALLPDRWRHRALTGQVVFALAVQSLLFTRW